MNPNRRSFLVAMAFVSSWLAGAAGAQTRPQTPRPPFPYEIVEVTLARSANVELGCTVTTPRVELPAPGAVLLTVAGANDRDQSFAGHRGFAVLADHLARHGIASIRCDDRGVGDSTGVLRDATLGVLAADANAMAARLATFDGVDSDAIGFIGNSEGCMVGPMAARLDPGGDFVVMLAGPGVSGREAILGQTLRLAERMSYSPAQIDALRRESEAFFDVLISTPDDDDAREALLRLSAARTVVPPTAARLAAGGRDAQIELFLSPWYRSSIAHDNRDVLRQLDVPVLAITGALDPVLPPDQNLPPMIEALAAAPTDDVSVVIAPRVNHPMQRAKTGMPIEYAMLDSSFDPSVLARISRWIGARFGAAAEPR